ncbi:MAG: hypothetical protein PUG55_04185 [Bacillales bacterium]|nr:hypothetical protein [Bacillales bacterium]
MIYLDLEKEAEILSFGYYKEYWTKQKKIILQAGMELGLDVDEIEHIKQCSFIAIKVNDLQKKNSSGKLSKEQIAKNNLEINKLTAILEEHFEVAEKNNYFYEMGEQMQKIRDRQSKQTINKGK